MTDFSQFTGKVCVVTGAASGIGRAVALRLANVGAHVAVSDINEDGLAETLSLIQAAEGAARKNAVLSDVLDISDEAAIFDYADRVKAALGDADYVFNIAGLARVGTFDNTPLSSFETVMTVNFYSVVRMSKAFLPQLKSTRGGLVNISSIFGIIGYPGQAHYCASKFAVRGFSETLAQELEGHGVSVTSVHPGGVATNIARLAQIDAMPAHGLSKTEMDAEFDKIAKTTPDKAAQIILRGTWARKRRVMVGGDAKLVQFISRVFPQSYARILRRLQPDSYKVL